MRPFRYEALTIGVLLLVGAFASAPSLPALEPGRVVGVVGRMGTGKTLLVVGWAIALRRLRPHSRIVTNFGLDCADQVVSSWAEVYELRDCVFILDEAHLWASSNSSKALNLQGRQWISQLRKRGVVLVWVSQSQARVAKALRELTTDLWVCRKMWGYHIVIMRDPDNEDAKPLGWSLRRLDLDAARAYRTRDDVPIPSDSTY